MSVNDLFARKTSMFKAGGDVSERAEKAKVRRRDKRCRRPHCPNCRAHRYRLALHVAHHRAKGMGGDKGTRSAAHQMFLLDSISHLEEYERHLLEADIVNTRLGTAGPLDFYSIQHGRRVFEGRSEAA